MRHQYQSWGEGGKERMWAHWKREKELNPDLTVVEFADHYPGHKVWTLYQIMHQFRKAEAEAAGTGLATTTTTTPTNVWLRSSKKRTAAESSSADADEYSEFNSASDSLSDPNAETGDTSFRGSNKHVKTDLATRPETTSKKSKNGTQTQTSEVPQSSDGTKPLVSFELPKNTIARPVEHDSHGTLPSLSSPVFPTASTAATPRPPEEPDKELMQNHNFELQPVSIKNPNNNENKQQQQLTALSAEEVTTTAPQIRKLLAYKLAEFHQTNEQQITEFSQAIETLLALSEKEKSRLEAELSTLKEQYEAMQTDKDAQIARLEAKVESWGPERERLLSDNATLVAMRDGFQKALSIGSNTANPNM